MYSDSLIDQLEIDFGTSILSDLTGEQLTRNGQPVRLFDQTKHTSEFFYKTGDKGKSYIQNFQDSTRLYPFTAYCKYYGVDAATALADLQSHYVTGPVSSRPRRPPPPVPPPPPVTFIPVEVYRPCRSRFGRNGLFLYLSSFFKSEQVARRIVDRYRLGTSRRWLYAGVLTTTLPQFDIDGNLRQVKVIAFHPETGRRAKKEDYAERWNARTRQYEPEQEDKVSIIGRELAGWDKTLKQCYFGEHLLDDLTKFVALVEGESTAIMMSETWPEFHWLATGGATGGSWDDPRKFAVFKGRKVVLFPDSGKFDDWSQRAEKLQGIAAELTVSRYVEDNVPKTKDNKPANNLDLRDLLTWPKWFEKDGTITSGEILPSTSADDYPVCLDEPAAPDAVTTIREKTVEEYQRQETPFSLRGITYDVARMHYLFWASRPAPPKSWNRIRAHQFGQQMNSSNDTDAQEQPLPKISVPRLVSTASGQPDADNLL